MVHLPAQGPNASSPRMLLAAQPTLPSQQMTDESAMRLVYGEGRTDRKVSASIGTFRYEHLSTRSREVDGTPVIST